MAALTDGPDYSALADAWPDLPIDKRLMHTLGLLVMRADSIAIGVGKIEATITRRVGCDPAPCDADLSPLDDEAFAMAQELVVRCDGFAETVLIARKRCELLERLPASVTDDLDSWRTDCNRRVRELGHAIGLTPHLLPRSDEG